MASFVGSIRGYPKKILILEISRRLMLVLLVFKLASEAEAVLS
jgi:hypothetical protein